MFYCVCGCQSVPKAAPSPSDTTLGYQSEVVPLRADPDFRGATMNNHRFIHFHYPTGSQVLARLHRFSIYSGKFSVRLFTCSGGKFVGSYSPEYIPYVKNSLKAFSTKNGKICNGFKKFKRRVVESATVNLVNDRNEVTGPTRAATNWEVNRKDGFCTHVQVGDPVRWVYSELK